MPQVWDVTVTRNPTVSAIRFSALHVIDALRSDRADTRLKMLAITSRGRSNTCIF